MKNYSFHESVTEMGIPPVQNHKQHICLFDFNEST